MEWMTHHQQQKQGTPLAAKKEVSPWSPEKLGENKLALKVN
jgi:hypothetical protein